MEEKISGFALKRFGVFKKARRSSAGGEETSSSGNSQFLEHFSLADDISFSFRQLAEGGLISL